MLNMFRCLVNYIVDKATEHIVLNMMYVYTCYTHVFYVHMLHVLHTCIPLYCKQPVIILFCKDNTCGSVKESRQSDFPQTLNST